MIRHMLDEKFAYGPMRCGPTPRKDVWPGAWDDITTYIRTNVEHHVWNDGRIVIRGRMNDEN